MELREILITNLNELPTKHVCNHGPYEYTKSTVVPKDDENDCCVAFYQIPPGKSNYPYHYHTSATEVFYIISGTGILETPSGQKTVTAGDIIVFPATEEGAHKLGNPSESEILTYLDFDTLDFPDVIFYPDSNKVGVAVSSKNAMFYKRDSDVDYYDGE